MFHGHFDGYFCIPSPAGAVIMLERADMLLAAMPSSQWPSPAPSLHRQSPQGLGAMDAFREGTVERGGEKLRKTKDYIHF